MIFVSRGTLRRNGSALLPDRNLCFTWNAFEIIVCEFAGAKPSFVSRQTVMAEPDVRFLLGFTFERVRQPMANDETEQVTFCDGSEK